MQSIEKEMWWVRNVCKWITVCLHLVIQRKKDAWKYYHERLLNVGNAYEKESLSNIETIEGIGHQN